MTSFLRLVVPARLVAAAALVCVTKAEAQNPTPASSAPVIRDESPTDPAPSPSHPVRLDLSRRDLKNFLTDEEALKPYRSGEGPPADLRDVFTVGSVDAPYAIFWDPLSCRLIGILDLEAPPESVPTPETAPSNPTGTKEGTAPSTGQASPYLLKATGKFPLAKTVGASGVPRFFGFRLVKGAPEFLYTCGSLAVEERLWLAEGGRVLLQRFSARDAARGLQITIPESWAGRVEASAGTWKGVLLTVPKEASAEVVLTYPLVPDQTPAPVKPDSN